MKIEISETARESGPNMGLCPGCGVIQAPGFVGGWYGWICGSQSRSHSGELIKFHQSNACASMHWRVRAEKVEAELREKDKRIAELEAALKSEIMRDGSWIDSDGACRMCGGEIPYGHLDRCDFYKVKAECDQLREQLTADTKRLNKLEKFLWSEKIGNGVAIFPTKGMEGEKQFSFYDLADEDGTHCGDEITTWKPSLREAIDALPKP